MRLLPSVSAGLLAFALGASAMAAPTAGPISVSRRFTATPAALEPAARSALREVVGPGLAAASFAPSRTIALRTGERVLKLAQTHQGLPVVQRGAAITFGADGVARHVSAWIEDDLPASVIPGVSVDVAAAVAAKRARLPADASRAELVIWPSADASKLAWVVAPESIPGVPYAPVVVVDALSGEVIVHFNTALHLNQAKVYPSNPKKSPALVEVTLPVGAGEGTLQNELISSRNCIDQKNTKTLQGITVHVCDLLQTATPDASGDYLQAPGADKDPEDAFAEVSMFHHATRAYEYFRTFDDKLDINAGQPLTTVSNLRIPQGFDTFDLAKLGNVDLPLVPFQNAFFAPSDPLFQTVFGLSGGTMWFGQGPFKDYSYDGDVVYHELTHAVVNATLKLVGTPHMDKYGTSMSPGSINEALADFFSSALTGDGDCGEYAVQDFSPALDAIRKLDNSDACPKDVGGEVHQDSTLFSGALWGVRKSLDAGKQAQFDAAVFSAMNSSATGDLGYEDMAKLLREALVASPLGKPVADALDAAFTAHGVLPECSRVMEHKGAPLTGPAALQGLWFAPGTQTTGATKDGWTPGVVQVHAALLPGATKLTVDLRKVDIGGGGGIFGGGGTPFKPKVLVLFGAAPITFTYKPLKAPADLLVVDPVASDNDYTVDVPVPPGATDVHVMIASAGQADGAYTTLDLTTDAVSSSSSSSSSGSTSSSSSSSGSAGETSEEGGCGCAVPGDETAPRGALAAALAALGLMLSRRRRR